MVFGEVGVATSQANLSETLGDTDPHPPAEHRRPNRHGSAGAEARSTRIGRGASGAVVLGAGQVGPLFALHNINGGKCQK